MRKWCPQCSSIDPFPTRRRLLLGSLVLLIVAGGIFIVVASPDAARSEATKIMSQTKSFATLAQTPKK
jgi:hypothetical protein